jgi:hypothetical protein
MSRFANIQQRILCESRDLLELVLLPGLAAVLPWSLCFRVFRRLAHWRWLYREVCEQAVREAQARGVIGDEAHWHWMRRLVTLIDHADYYLSRTRGDRWLLRHVTVDGAWPPPDRAGILCTFHWGAGMWGLRSAAHAGLCAHKLVGPLDEKSFHGRRVLGWYARARSREEVPRALGQSVIDTSASLRPVIGVLRAQQQVLAVIDVPADQVAASEPVTLMDRPARIPRGL